MVTELMENGMYKACDGEKVLCTITSLGNNIYRAVNMDCDITAEVYVPDSDIHYDWIIEETTVI